MNRTERPASPQQNDAAATSSAAPLPARPVGFRRLRRLARTVLITVVVCLAAWWGLLYLMQDQMMFPAQLAPRYAQANPPPGTWVMHRDIEGGKVEAWYCPLPAASDQHPAPLVIFFHGNAEVIDQQRNLVQAYHRLGLSVLMVEYRGYGRSAGQPGQAALREDLLHFWPLVTNRPEVDRRRVVLHGRSLGGGVAADLSRQVPAAGLILESTFYNTAAVAHEYLAPGFLCRNSFRTDLAVAAFDGPVLLLHGRRDSILPIRHARNLARLSPRIQLIEYDRDHNDMLHNGNDQRYWNDIRQYLQRHGFQAEK